MITGTGKGLLTTGLPTDQGECDQLARRGDGNPPRRLICRTARNLVGKPRDPKKGTGLPCRKGTPAAAVPFPRQLLPSVPPARKGAGDGSSAFLDPNASSTGPCPQGREGAPQ